MRWFATVLVAVMSMVHLASASRINFDFAHHIAGKRKEEAPSKGKGKGKKGAQSEKGKGKGDIQNPGKGDIPGKGQKSKGNGKSSKLSSRSHYDDRGSDEWGYAPSDGDFPPLVNGMSKIKDAAVLPLPFALVVAEEKDAPEQSVAADEVASVLPLPSAEKPAEENDAIRMLLLQRRMLSKSEESAAAAKAEAEEAESAAPTEVADEIAAEQTVAAKKAKVEKVAAWAGPGKWTDVLSTGRAVDIPREKAATKAVAEEEALHLEVASMAAATNLRLHLDVAEEKASAVRPPPPAVKAAKEKDASEQSASVEKTAAEEVTEEKGWIAELETQKEVAIATEDFLGAQRIKLEIKTLQSQALEKVAEAEVVKVAGLDFNTHMWVITRELYNFGRALFGFSFGHGEKHYWPGGWVMRCPEEGEKEVPRHSVPNSKDYIFVGRLDVGSIEMVPSKWWLKKGSGYDPGPKMTRDQKDVKAVRRSTVNSRYLCLWTELDENMDRKVVILRYPKYATQQHCWSHEMSIDANDRIADLCK